ncbi:DUF6384 family protein [Methylocystis bryophila]|uniref:Uncharacterized protein n=1 Tax=Methylocystis bryophila TaxID=655015 RepID=A0A1W6MYX0_9HYPH|nr:DUF6384 family protein [Methylocystis bryophila]ARN82753.1 hypothetical protein B1812_18510 [Methylocystis bryophila]BDV38991.1 hypothetical protein DSM21852_22440 [Methylocystis bryophila]
MSDAATAAQSPKLDDLMLAMDVVDTLRHDQRVVERELSASLSDEALIERLREIYKGQGIQVSDQVLQEGVKALREKRFSYVPPAPGLARSLALMWIDRARYGWILFGVVAFLAAFAAGHYFLVTQPQEQARAREAQEITVTLPKELNDDFADVMRESKVEQAKKAAAQILADGRAALERRDLSGARKAIADMAALLSELRAVYVLRIVNRRGEASGVWRRPPNNPEGRNDYLIVEAVTPDGQVLPRKIMNEETGQLSTVDKWGLRVSRQTYERVAAEKRQTGIIESNIVAKKERGYLDLDYTIPVIGGTLTKW